MALVVMVVVLGSWVAIVSCAVAFYFIWPALPSSSKGAVSSSSVIPFWLICCKRQKDSPSLGVWLLLLPYSVKVLYGRWTHSWLALLCLSDSFLFLAKLLRAHRQFSVMSSPYTAMSVLHLIRPGHTQTEDCRHRGSRLVEAAAM